MVVRTIIAIGVSIFLLSACGGYQGNVELKARAWANDCGCSKVSDFRMLKYIAGTANNNNGEVFDKPAQAAYAEFTFNCYFTGAGTRKWDFSVFMLNHPITSDDFGFMGAKSAVMSRSARSGFRPS